MLRRCVPSQSCRLRPDRNQLRPSGQGDERMTSLSEIVEVVIGVDTHVRTHSAAAVDARTGGVLGEVTVEATPEGYQALVDFAGAHSLLRAWAVEGTGGHGAGLARLLARRYELVLELDRPERARRRNGAKSDPLDAIRAAREALSRAKLGTPRSAGQRQALSVLLAARRSAWLPGCGSAPAGTSRRPPPPGCCATWPSAPWNSATRSPATRKTSWPSSAPGGPTCSPSPASAPSSPPRCCAPGPTPAGSAPRPPSPCSPAPPPSPPAAARPPPATGSTAPETASSTGPCTPPCSPASATTRPPGP